MTSIDMAACEGRAPEVALRQIFLIAGVEESDRVTIAKNGFTTVDLIANLADDLPAFHSAITTLFSEDMGDGAAKLIKLATLATMWRQCKALGLHEGRSSVKTPRRSKPHTRNCDDGVWGLQPPRDRTHGLERTEQEVP